MRHFIRGAAVLVGALALCATPALGADWELLGERAVNYQADRDVIVVTRAEGRFTKIALGCKGNGIEILDVKVHFANGETFDASVRSFIKAGDRTRAIDLPGEARAIQKVDLIYRTRGIRDGKGHVLLWGMEADGPPPAAPTPPPAPALTWEKLGARQVDFGAERDVIPVSAGEGRFAKMQLRVEENGVEIIDVTVHFGNGEKQDVQIRDFIEKGGHTRVIDLDGGSRIIEKVALVYRTRGKLRRGRARVEAWGVRVGAAPSADPPSAPAAPVHWQTLGERIVGLGADRDVIPVTAAEGRFKSIKLFVDRSGIEILDLKVHFGNGGVEDVSVRSFIPAGGETRVIDLKGEARVIQKIELWYRTRGAQRGRALVRVLGKGT